MELNKSFWIDKTVFLTGHTGFKGGWMVMWLNNLGAKVHGYALQPLKTSNLFDIAHIESQLVSSTIADIRDSAKLQSTMETVKPEIVIHMAAQPLVRISYSNPLETYETNVMGTVNLFEAVRNTPGVKVVVNVTTDKCYENREWIWPYREIDPMGGYDPYSSSKACVELITSAYRCSFFDEANIQLASVRAGNVIGGGDWADDRLIPDFLCALDNNKELTIRSPNATRPWQHVLEPLSGYMMLAEKLYNEGKPFSEAWNFGPEESDIKKVEWIVEYLCKHISGASWKICSESQPHEANILKLDNTKAKTMLEWYPKWNLSIALDKTLEWYTSWKEGENMAEVSLQQIYDYEN